MGTKKSFVKGLAAGAVLAAAASLVMETGEEKGKTAKELQNTAGEIAKRVTKHAMKLGKLTKAAYGKIVDTTIAEYRGVKALSEDELKELKAELKDGWGDLSNIVKKRVSKKKPAKRKPTKKRRRKA